jgi:hypothetical protein
MTARRLICISEELSLVNFHILLLHLCTVSVHDYVAQQLPISTHKYT